MQQSMDVLSATVSVSSAGTSPPALGAEDSRAVTLMRPGMVFSRIDADVIYGLRGCETAGKQLFAWWACFSFSFTSLVFLFFPLFFFFALTGRLVFNNISDCWSHSYYGFVPFGNKWNVLTLRISHEAQHFVCGIFPLRLIGPGFGRTPFILFIVIPICFNRHFCHSSLCSVCYSCTHSFPDFFSSAFLNVTLLFHFCCSIIWFQNSLSNYQVIIL